MGEYIVLLKDPYGESEPILLAFKRDDAEYTGGPIIRRVKRVIDEVKNRYPGDYQFVDLLEALEEEFGEQFLGDKEHTVAYW